ncbi:uncharacterized protein LOC117173882 [Belonocnema kinseyi]|uniref:uncharacterized protein LOC117173882 n=1 Tax=Belonocnema kinseyi TaxID=2817044 RepID=UPI00143CC351|nr:uncharacterized protein LOC117173882 [Belonocnema kinseyi]
MDERSCWTNQQLCAKGPRPKGLSLQLRHSVPTIHSKWEKHANDQDSELTSSSSGSPVPTKVDQSINPKLSEPSAAPRRSARISELRSQSPSESTSESPSTQRRPSESVGPSSSLRPSSPPPQGRKRTPTYIFPENGDLLYRNRVAFAIYHERLDEFVLITPDRQIVNKNGTPKRVTLQDLKKDDLLIQGNRMKGLYSVINYKFVLLPPNWQRLIAP